MAPRVSIEQRQQIVVLRASGCSIKEIGRRTGITRATINLWLRRNEETGGDLTARQRQNYKRKTTAEQDAAILVAHYNRPRLSTRDTATEHKVSTQTIRRRLKAVGLKIKKTKENGSAPPEPQPMVPFEVPWPEPMGAPVPGTSGPPPHTINPVRPQAPAKTTKPPTKRARKKPEQSSFSNIMCMANEIDPSELRLEEMLNGPERGRWKHAMMHELQTYVERDVWETVDRQSERYRARLLLLRVVLKSLA